MFVKAPYRGARHGVAAHERLVAAHRFYEKNGFCRIGRSELPAAFPVTAVDTIFYRLDLLS